MDHIQLEEDIVLAKSRIIHAEGLLETVNHNREHLGEFLSWVTKMVSVSDFESYLQHCITKEIEGQELSFTIFRKYKAIGRIALHQIDTTNQNTMIGYWLCKDEMGKGIISKACKTLISYGFEALDLNRIEILTASHNTRSMAIPERLGFTKEGTLRQIEKHNDAFFDLNVYSILKSEWNAID